MLAPIEDTKDLILAVLEAIPNMFLKTQSVQTNLGKAVLVARQIFQNVGGHMFIFCANDYLAYEVHQPSS